MNPEQQQVLDEHIQEIAKILHEDTPPEELKSLAGIEQAVRNQVQKHIAPKIGFFLLKQRREQVQDTKEQ
jgi:hypothetical protein